MNDFPDTSKSLIVGIQDSGNVKAWREFERLYRPIIFRIARAKGLQHADAFDLVQLVLLSVSNAIGRYEVREGGPPFRNWLSRITRYAILKALTRKPQDLAVGGSEFIDVLSETPAFDQETDDIIQLEYRREIFKRAVERIRGEVQPKTWLVFEMTVMNGESIETVSNRLNISIGNVYAARSRMMKRLRETVAHFESDDEVQRIDSQQGSQQ
ncbi:MAG: sigma-70 family RNA polymerase sigma factor [Planctomycetota bacterium]